MNYHTRMGKVIGLIMLLGIGVSARAQDDLALVPYIEAGTMDYTLSFNGAVPLPDGTFFKADTNFYFDFMSVRLGLAAGYRDFSVNIYYLTTDKDSDDQDFPGLPFPSVAWEGEKSVYSGTLSYNVFKTVSLFGGYRYSETRGSGSFNSDYKLEHDGYFAGANYRMDVTETGALSFSLGYAWLDMKLRERLVTFELPHIEGDGTGFKAGVNWRGFFNEALGYTVGVEYFKYEYDGSNPGGPTASNLVTEEETAFNFGLFYLL